MSETEDISTGEVTASEDMDQEKSKVNSAKDTKDSVKSDSNNSAEKNKISELKEKVILNGDNGNSMDSISNGHEGNENSDNTKSASASNGENEEATEGDASNGDGDCEEVASNGGAEEVTIEEGEVSTRENTDGEEISNGASSTPVVSEPTSPQRQHQKRKEPQVVRIDEGEDDTEDITEDTDDDLDGEEEGEEEEDDVQLVKDDSSDSDIMEVEAEDPLSGGSGAAGGSNSVSISSSVTSTEVKKPQVVTIDDPKTLQALASSAKSNIDKEKVTIIDTSAILSGRATSGVTITPARAKAVVATPSPAAANVNRPKLPASLTSTLAASGVTISQKAGSAPSPGSGFVYDSKGQLQDPNLTDDTVVIEAPSFIVPYVYEKPPRETFSDFKTEIKKIMAELKKEEQEKAKNKKPDDEDEEKEEKKKEKKKDKKKGKKKKKKISDGSGEEDNGENSDDDDYKSEEDDDLDVSSDDSDADSEIIEVKKRAQSPELPEVKKPNENFFESTLGKFITDLGMNLVQEAVQKDLLKQQQQRAKKEKSAAVMHAISSLKHNIEQSKENNQHFRLETIRCKHCPFRTESELALAHHMETPHMKNGMYRCNYCHYDTKLAHEVVGHMQAFHEVRPRLERAPALHSCPQCPFEDMMKGKLTRHKVGCDKRFRPERNQEPPHDWDPPAKIPKPPQSHRAGVSVLNAQGRQQNLAAVRGALSQFNQQGARMQGNKFIRQQNPHAIRGALVNQFMQHGARMQGRPYGAMPALQFGPGRGRPPQPFQKPFIPNVGNRNITPQRNILPAFGQASRLAGNPSVTIQSISKTGGLKSNNPSISITPVPGGKGMALPGRNIQSAGLKPGAPSSGANKDNFVICEICDGYIRDLEQLRNHMQFIHKVKIHPKMIYNRPPLNCQKCQFRFFTDQGLERHLLGSHGLVTASMQDLANKGQDSGRCPVCGKMFHWKLLNHVAKDHSKTLKPAHLSYKCTVCTATFGQYKLFETHVYSAHSGGRKNVNKPTPPAASKPSPAGRPSPVAGKPFKMSDEITIIPQGRNTQKTPTTSSTNKPTSVASAQKKPPAPADDDIIELDDEEEIDDVEDEGEKKKNGNQNRKRKSDDDTTENSNAKSNKTSTTNSDAAEESGGEGVEEIRDDEEEEDD